MTDDAALKAAFEAHTAGQGKFTRRMAIVMGSMFEMRPMSMVWRLEKLGLLRRGSWDWFKANGGITSHHIREAQNTSPPSPSTGEQSDG